jgi:16S rRNA processing protein RimM
MTEKFIIGLVGSPFGVKGFVKINPCSGEIEHLLKLKSAVISKDGKERTLQIEESAPALPALIMRFAGIDTPEKAKTLNGAKLIAGREQATPLSEGEFYIEDLKGLAVYAQKDEVEKLNPDSSLRLCALRTEGSPPLRDEISIIGEITDIIEGGGGELAEIKLSDGEKRLIPFRKEFFSEICPQKGRVILKNLWILE